MARTACAAIAVVCICGLCSAQSTMPAWELREGGRWQQTAVPATAPVREETLDRVEEMIQNRQYEAAHKIVVAWLRLNKTSPVRDRGIYLLGQANFGRGERIMAFYNFDELLDRYPDSRYYYAALQRQYDIADAFLRGYKRKFLGMPILPAREEATEMLYRIQQRAPGSPLAEKALLRVADYYYANGDFDVAADAYAAYVRGYPRSPLVDQAKLREAFSVLAQFRGVKFDATCLVDARQQLVELSMVNPQLADRGNIPEVIRRIDAALARKLLVTAEFYRRTGKKDAMRFYYELLVKRYPDSPEAQTARRELGMAQPPPSSGAPATRGAP